MCPPRAESCSVPWLPALPTREKQMCAMRDCEGVNKWEMILMFVLPHLAYALTAVGATW